MAATSSFGVSRAELEKQMQKLDDFMKQRDARIAREKPTVDGLASRVDV